MEDDIKTERAVILVKAAPQPSERYQETVCCAGVTLDKRWVRLFPVQFRALEDAKKFNRWNWIEYSWRRPRNDHRPESRHVSDDKIQVLDKLPARERSEFLRPLLTSSLESESSEGRTLALLRPRNVRFRFERRAPSNIDTERKRRLRLSKQQDFFAIPLVPLEPCPYVFRFDYECDDGKATRTCYDWETDATFFRFRNAFGEQRALSEMTRIFGDEYPAKGMVFAMGTHSRRPTQWLLVGIIRSNEPDQLSLL